MLIGISDQMGTRFDRLRCEVFQNLILSPMNTGLLRPAVATVLTVYGIETAKKPFYEYRIVTPLQQSLPFTVLKRPLVDEFLRYGALQQSLPFTVLKHLYCSCNKVRFNALQQSLPFTVLKQHHFPIF